MRASEQTLVIEPARGHVRLDLDELWSYRELLYFLVWRDLKVRYKQTALGAAWAVLQPFLTMVVFSVIFGKLGRLPSDGVPYPVFAFAALVPWTYFSAAIAAGANALVGSQQLLSKVYFPRLLVPLSAVVTPLVDLVIAFAILVVMMAWFRLPPGVAVIWLPLFVVFVVATALAVSLWLAALNVEYRDVRYVIPFLVQFWLFATPVAYPASMVPARWRMIFGLNPMVGIIEGFRWALFGTPPPGGMLWMSVLVVVAMLVGGLAYFRRMEGTFADVL